MSVTNKITPATIAAGAHLYEPNDLVRWRRGSRVGSTGARRFVGSSPSSSVQVYYSLGDEAKAKLVAELSNR